MGNGIKTDIKTSEIEQNTKINSNIVNVVWQGCQDHLWEKCSPFNKQRWGNYISMCKRRKLDLYLTHTHVHAHTYMHTHTHRHVLYFRYRTKSWRSPWSSGTGSTKTLIVPGPLVYLGLAALHDGQSSSRGKRDGYCFEVSTSKCWYKRERRGDFPGGTVVKNLPANARDTGLSSKRKTSHIQGKPYQAISWFFCRNYVGRRVWHDVFKVLKGKTLQPRIMGNIPNIL